MCDPGISNGIYRPRPTTFFPNFSRRVLKFVSSLLKNPSVICCTDGSLVMTSVG